MPQGASFPVRSRKVDGRWRIDAAPIIASMKGAGAAPARKTIDPGQIKDKIAINLDQKIDLQFNRKGDAISGPKVVGEPKAGEPTQGPCPSAPSPGTRAARLTSRPASCR